MFRIGVSLMCLGLVIIIAAFCSLGFAADKPAVPAKPAVAAVPDVTLTLNASQQDSIKRAAKFALMCKRLSGKITAQQYRDALTVINDPTKCNAFSEAVAEKMRDEAKAAGKVEGFGDGSILKWFTNPDNLKTLMSILEIVLKLMADTTPIQSNVADYDFPPWKMPIVMNAG